MDTSNPSFCVACGAQLPATGAFCIACGHQIADPPEPPAGAPPDPVPPPAPTHAAPRDAGAPPPPPTPPRTGLASGPEVGVGDLVRRLRPTRRAIPVLAVFVVVVVAIGVLVKLVHPARSAVQRDTRSAVEHRLKNDPELLRGFVSRSAYGLLPHALGEGERRVRPRNPKLNVAVRAVRGRHAIARVTRTYSVRMNDGTGRGASKPNELLPVTERATVSLQKATNGTWKLRWAKGEAVRLGWSRPADPPAADVSNAKASGSAVTLAYNAVDHLLAYRAGEDRTAWNARQAAFYVHVGAEYDRPPKLKKRYLTYDIDNTDSGDLDGLGSLLSSIEASDPDAHGATAPGCATVSIVPQEITNTNGHIDGSKAIPARPRSPWQIAEVWGTTDATVSEVSGTTGEYLDGTCALPSTVDSRVFYRAVLVRSRAVRDSKWFVARLATRTSPDLAVDVFGGGYSAVTEARRTPAPDDPATWLGVAATTDN